MSTPQFVLVSHASVDKPKIRFIVEALIQQNIKVWLDNPGKAGFSADEVERDFYRIRAGEPWRAELRDALHISAAVLVCWSASSIKSNEVAKEATIGLDRNKLVSCQIEDFDKSRLSSDYAAEQIADLRPRPEQQAQLALLLTDVKNKMIQSSRRGIEQRTPRDPFEPYLVDRTRQENLIGDAISALAGRQNGVRPFLVLGPQNECPNEFIERLDKHTSKIHLRDGCWFPIRVEWPEGCDPAKFAGTYRNNLSFKLGLPVASENPDEQVAKRLSELERPAAVVSGIYARQWDADEPKRIASWLDWWESLARGPSRIGVIPIFRIVMERAKPGWQKRGYPSECHRPLNLITKRSTDKSTGSSMAPV
jgi:hypothetical protein